MLKIFFHCACMNYFGDVKNEIVEVVQRSGLEAAADEIYVCVAGKKNLTVLLPEKWKQVYFSRLDQFEYPALHMLWHNTQTGDKVLYLHTKGVASPAFKEGTAAWRRYMLWGCVERWRECVAALDRHDTAGVLLIDQPGMWARKIGAEKFYGGNFWWARGDHIKRLPCPIVEKNRWHAEGWVMGGRPRAFCLHNISGGKLVTAKKSPGYFSFLDVHRGDYDPNTPRPRPRVKSRIEIIQRLIDQRGYKSYLEIGVWRHDCFKRVQCARKVSVDPDAKPAAMFPMTSDEYFKKSWETFDIVFIDGLHTAEQVARDIEHALARLNPGGVIVLHDCNPETEYEQRDTVTYDGDGVWVGTVWKTFAALRMTRPDLRMAVVDTDFGVGIIERGMQKLFPKAKIDYPFFVKNRVRLMNVIEPEEFEPWIKR